jgi:outer membrane protein insertion porin family
MGVKRSVRFLSYIILSVFVVGGPTVVAQEGQVAKGTRLSRIEFVGLQSRTQDEAMAASGLKVGQEIDIPTLDAAAQRLLDSGLFKGLSYRLRTNADQAVVIFKVEEDTRAAERVVFDNFVWFSDEELMNAVRAQVPAYDGTAPDSAVNGITRALRQLLQERKIAGSVEYMLSDTSGKMEHVFSVEGAKIPICAIHYTGATAVQEDELVRNSKPLMAEDYRQSFVLAFAKANLIPIYRERGHLRARFQPPQAKQEAGGKCKDGVAVTVGVEEGLVYSWDKAEWSGNAALTAAELEAALGMKAGELANGLKIDKGINSVLRAYGSKGYLTARVRPTPSFEDTNRRVSFRMEIKEGPQYRMGALTITGLSESTTNRLRGRWKLQPGDVYDDSYLDEFLKLVLTPDMLGGDRPKKIDSKPKLNDEKLTVDVTIDFK